MMCLARFVNILAVTNTNHSYNTPIVFMKSPNESGFVLLTMALFVVVACCC